MATVTIDQQFKTDLAKRYVKSFDAFRDENSFIFIGRVLGDAQSTRTEQNDDATRKNILFAKLITPDDVSLLIPRVNWTSGTLYDEYDPSLDMTTKNYYVYNEANSSVYVCFKKGEGSSVNIPNTTAPDPEVFSDGYEWRYIFTVSSANQKFIDDDYIPIETLPYYSGLVTAYGESAKQSQYFSQYAAITDALNGTIRSVGITGTNTAVYGKSILSNPDRTLLSAGKTSAVLGGGIANASDDYYNGYAVRFVDGNAIGIVAEITDYVGADNQIIYGSITGATPDVGDKYEILPLVDFTGDGSGATAYVEVNTDFTAREVVVTDVGSNYSNVTAVIGTAKDSGTAPTLAPRIFDALGKDPVSELLPVNVKLRVKIEGDENANAMIGNDYNEVGIWGSPSVGISYSNTGLSAGFDNFTSTVVDVKPASGQLSKTFVSDFSNDFIFGNTNNSFGRVISVRRDGESSGTLTIKNIKGCSGGFTTDEVIQNLQTVGSTLASQGGNLKHVRTRTLDSSLTVIKSDWRCTHEIGISYNNSTGNSLPLIDTSITGASLSTGTISEVRLHPSAANGATMYVTNVQKGFGSGTLSFTPSEIVTCGGNVGGVTVQNISGPELDLNSGNLLYIDGITAVSRNQSSDDVVELVIEF
tara:strand:+ start:204 stop:2132 length:1929 start_codon:yes stop_codon:yes gene_type:complete